MDISIPALTVIGKSMDTDVHDLTSYEKGIMLAKKGRNTEALDFFDVYLKINPSVERAWYSKGLSLYNIGDYDAALKCFDKTIEINPNADYAWYSKGLLFEDVGKNQEARSSYDTSIGINPDYAKQIPNKYPIMVMTDEPSTKGFLDFRKYAKSLANIIENSKPRFTVGVFGGWGTGKTTLMLLIREQLEENKKILRVWFDAWRYEREEYLAVIPFLRTMRLELEQFAMSNSTESYRWNGVKKGIERTVTAFLNATKLTIGVKGVISAEINFAEVLKSFNGDGSIGNDFNTIYYDAKAFLEHALDDLRKEDPSFRIVVFIDDLDRCRPEKALEVLESIKSFFDIEGIIYVIGMNDASIDSLIDKKYGKDPQRKIKGFDYMKKIVQLPFQIPDWTESDILNFLDSIILYEVKDSIVGKDFSANINLLVKAIEANPREVKRFVNQIILAKSVFDKPVDNLIVVQALRFNAEWRWFLDYITSFDHYGEFLDDYDRFFEQDNVKKSLDTEANKKDAKFRKEDIVRDYPSFKGILEVYPSFFEQGNTLRSFLDAGAAEKLREIHNMEEYRRALEVVSLEQVYKSPFNSPRKSQPLPDPTGEYPYHLSLSYILPAEKISHILDSGGISFHTVGNTGIGNGTSKFQQRVAMAMMNQFDSDDYNKTTNPAFLYLLGDLVYYSGKAEHYYEQFYKPYALYPAPIFAIPGNHDGQIDTRPGDPVDTEPSLFGFMRNFCAALKEVTSDAREIKRPAMIQPNVYWTLEAPFVTIIGLYSNIWGELDDAQREWLVDELKKAPKEKAIILSIHHGPYSLSYQGSSKIVGSMLDDAFLESGRIVDLVISSQLMNYQRFTRKIAERQIPYIVAGAGGYYNLHRLQGLHNAEDSPIKVPYKIHNEDVILENYHTESHGFLYLHVTSKSIAGTYFAVPHEQESSNLAAQKIDSFELDLEKNRIARSENYKES